MALLALFAALVGYLLLPHIAYYRHHHERAARERLLCEEETSTDGGAMAAFRAKIVEMATVARLVWVQLYNVFITFYVTLAVFPAVLADVHPSTCFGMGMSK